MKNKRLIVWICVVLCLSFTLALASCGDIGIGNGNSTTDNADNGTTAAPDDGTTAPNGSDSGDPDEDAPIVQDCNLGTHDYSTDNQNGSRNH